MSMNTTTAAALPPPPPPPRLRLERVRVRVMFRTSPDGATVERDLTESLLGIGKGGNSLPLLCTSHRLDFAVISRTIDGLPTDYFFSPERAIDAPRLSTPEDNASSTESVMAYNFFNMLSLLLPGVGPIPGRYAQFVSLKEAKPARAVNTAVPLQAARLRPSASAADIATPGVVRGGAVGSSERWIKVWERRVSLRRARLLDWSSLVETGQQQPRPVRGGAQEKEEDTIDTGKYTVFRSTWINDAVNHPVYSALIRSILEYQQWYEETSAQGVDLFPVRTRFLNELTATFPDPKDKKKEINMAEQTTFPTALKAIAEEKSSSSSSSSSSRPENSETTGLRNDLIELNENYRKLLEVVKKKRQQKNQEGSSSDMEERIKQEEKQAMNDFMDKMVDVRRRQRTVEGTKSTGSMDSLASARQTLSALAPILGPFQAVEMEQMANSAIASMDVQYDAAEAMQGSSDKSNRAAPQLTAKYMQDTHPQFVQIANVLRTFHKTYVPANRKWRNIIQTIVTDKPQAKSAFLALMYACKELTEGRIIGQRRNETMKNGPTGKDLLPLVGLDLVLSSSSSSSSSTAAAAPPPPPPPSGGASALSPLREAYVQCDVAGFAYTGSDMGPAVCAFRDFYLGAAIRHAFYRRPTPWVGQIPAPLFMPPPTTKSSSSSPPPPENQQQQAKKSRVA